MPEPEKRPEKFAEACIEEYIECVMAAARLAPGDARRVRGELREHLTGLLESQANPNRTEEEIRAMTEKEFGDPAGLGRQIAVSKGRFRTYLKRKGRSFAIAAAAVVVLALSVKSFALGAYRIPGASVEPYAVRGSHVLVNRLAGEYAPNDLAVFRAGSVTYIAIVREVLPSGDLILWKNTEPDRRVAKSDLVGRVILQTR